MIDYVRFVYKLFKLYAVDVGDGWFSIIHIFLKYNFFLMFLVQLLVSYLIPTWTRIFSWVRELFLSKGTVFPNKTVCCLLPNLQLIKPFLPEFGSCAITICCYVKNCFRAWNSFSSLKIVPAQKQLFAL